MYPGHLTYEIPQADMDCLERIRKEIQILREIKMKKNKGGNMKGNFINKGGHSNSPTVPKQKITPPAMRPKETIDKMRDRHKKEIENLQANCKHEEISDWMEQMWAPGHFSGPRVKVCEICGKVVETKQSRAWCGDGTKVSSTGLPPNLE